MKADTECIRYINAKKEIQKMQQDMALSTCSRERFLMSQEIINIKLNSYEQHGV